MIDNDNRTLMVTIICAAYNQEQYIRQCLDGFVMQRTSFRFEAIVHDDASTDKTAEIIKEYANRFPGIIIPILETENQYSKHDGSLRRILANHTRGKYVAVCEGDDYWIDAEKLEKQFEYMETHLECSMCFHANKKLMPSGEVVSYRPHQRKEQYSAEEIILGGGSFMSTNSFFYRRSLYPVEVLPKFWRECPIGDLPTALFFAAKGKIGYIDEEMSVYRVGAVGSWTSNQNTLKKRNSHFNAILKMYDEYDEFTDYKYHAAIKKKKQRNSLNHIKSNIILIIRIILARFGITI
jgi:Glycosyltransferases involved in cell wall biogenesis